MRSGLCISNMVYLDQFVCLSDGVILKVVATSIAEIDRPVYHDVRNSMPHPTRFRCQTEISKSNRRSRCSAQRSGPLAVTSSFFVLYFAY